jgi:hypothetical protein
MTRSHDLEVDFSMRITKIGPHPGELAVLWAEDEHGTTASCTQGKNRRAKLFGQPATCHDCPACSPNKAGFGLSGILPCR